MPPLLDEVEHRRGFETWNGDDGGAGGQRHEEGDDAAEDVDERGQRQDRVPRTWPRSCRSPEAMIEQTIRSLVADLTIIEVD